MMEFTNIFKSGQIFTDAPDVSEDFYKLSDFQRDHNYWHGTIINALKALSSSGEDYLIIAGGELTYAGAGRVSLSKSVSIGKDSAGNPRFVFMPQLDNIPIPTAWRNNRQVWAIAEYDSILTSARRVHFEGTEYNYILKDSFRGEGEVQEILTDQDPTGRCVILGSFRFNGTTFTPQPGRSRAYDLRLLDEHKEAPVLDHPDRSVFMRHLSDEVRQNITMKLTRYQGAYQRLYPVPGDTTYRKATVFLRDVECHTIQGDHQPLTSQEQVYPASRLCQSVQYNTSTYTVQTILIETPQHSGFFICDDQYKTHHFITGFFVPNIGSGYSHFVLVLHDVGNNLISKVEMTYAEVEANLFLETLFVRLDTQLTLNQTYHYHVYVRNLGSGATPILRGSASQPFAFWWGYLPQAGKYGGPNTGDIIRLLDEEGHQLVNIREEGNHVLDGYDYYALDLSDENTWNSFEYQEFIAVDLHTGRIKLPQSLNLRDNVIYVEFNVRESLDRIDAKNILSHTSGKSVQDTIDLVESKFSDPDELSIKKITSTGITDAVTIQGRAYTDPLLASSLGLEYIPSFNYEKLTFNNLTHLCSSQGSLFLLLSNPSLSDSTVTVYDLVSNASRNIPVTNLKGRFIRASESSIYVASNTSLRALSLMTGQTTLTFPSFTDIIDLQWYDPNLFLLTSTQLYIIEPGTINPVPKVTFTNGLKAIFDGKAAWILTASSIIHFNIQTSTATTIPQTSPKNIAFDGVNLWIIYDSYLMKITRYISGGEEPDFEDILLSISVTNPKLLAFDGKHIWCASTSSTTSDLIQIFRINSGTIKESFSIPTVNAMSFDGVHMWLAHNSTGKISRYLA